MRDGLADEVRDLVHRRAGLLLFGREVDEQALANGRAERVNGDEAALGVFFLQLLAGDQMCIRDSFEGGRTQMEVAGQIGISQAQVSRLEKSAIRSIRKAILPS